jgi:hypothetical protein
MRILRGIGGTRKPLVQAVRQSVRGVDEGFRFASLTSRDAVIKPCMQFRSATI